MTKKLLCTLLLHELHIYYTMTNFYLLSSLSFSSFSRKVIEFDENLCLAEYQKNLSVYFKTKILVQVTACNIPSSSRQINYIINYKKMRISTLSSLNISFIYSNFIKDFINFFFNFIILAMYINKIIKYSDFYILNITIKAYKVFGLIKLRIEIVISAICLTYLHYYLRTNI